MEEIQETIQVYKPEIIKERALSLDPQTIAYAPKLVDAAKDGMIPVTLEDDVVIQRISHDLYANASSGFRELFNNEARACRIAKKKYGANPMQSFWMKKLRDLQQTRFVARATLQISETT